MADNDPAQAERLKTITNNLAAIDSSLKQAAGHVWGLVQAGRATCDEVKTYNTWALGLYNLQVGMLDTLRAGGEPNIPQLPPQPTYFAWQNVEGPQAATIDCGSQGGLSDSLAAVFRGPAPDAVFLSTNEIRIVTQDSSGADAAKPWAAIMESQARNEAERQKDGLGLAFVVWIVIAVFTVAVTVTITAILKYLEVSQTNEANSEVSKLQAAAYSEYLRARLACIQACTSRGGSFADCNGACKDIAPPEIGGAPGTAGKWGMLQWVGAITLGSIAILISYKLYRRKVEHGSIFPSLPEAWQLPG